MIELLLTCNSPLSLAVLKPAIYTYIHLNSGTFYKLIELGWGIWILQETLVWGRICFSFLPRTSAQHGGTPRVDRNLTLIHWLIDLCFIYPYAKVKQIISPLLSLKISQDISTAISSGEVFSSFPKAIWDLIIPPHIHLFLLQLSPCESPGSVLYLLLRISIR